MNGPADDATRPAEDAAPAGGEREVPALVLSLARELVERADIGLDDDFFSVGGDSVLAMHLVSRLARQTALRLRVSVLFANPRLADFAAQVEQLRAAAGDALDRTSAGSLAAALAARSVDGSTVRAS
ncbi:phosphopantetheine-binding protein [Kitasatospora terrestris]|uniref:Carrier domain-containing protein n=1 Tax=Kitasatospora terrestris TaxID=258051 RepID=A0ABP9DCG1_9ACTN